MSTFYDGKKRVTSPSDLPTGTHYVILEFSSVTIPGDERSRTHPGHGYPAYEQPTVECIVFQTEARWKQEIATRTADEAQRFRPAWIPLMVVRPEVVSSVTVTVR